MAGGRKCKPASSSSSTQLQNTLVLDNGGYTLKAGLVARHGGEILNENNNSNGPLIIANSIARDGSNKTYVGNDIEQCPDLSELHFRRPVEKGFIVNWEAQKCIWDRCFMMDEKTTTTTGLKCDPAETRLLLAEPPNGLPVLQSNCDQIVFEEYGFASYYRGIGPTFNTYHDVQNLFQTPRDVATVSNSPAEVLLVVDTGYSHTTITPVLAGRPIHSAVRRLDVGGKLLTNYMTRLVCSRQFDLSKDFSIINEMKESVCFVSSDFKADLEKTWRGTVGERRPDWVNGTLAKDYILPDFHVRRKGMVVDYDPARHSMSRRIEEQSHEDVITLRNERFSVPEIIFNPSHIGMRQPGLADIIQESLHSLPIGLWPGFLANIIVVGGNALFDGFIQRLQKEVIQRFPDDCIVRVARPEDPITSTWHGAAHLANHQSIEKLSVTKEEYFECGGGYVAQKFAKGLNLE